MYNKIVNYIKGEGNDKKLDFTLESTAPYAFDIHDQIVQSFVAFFPQFLRKTFSKFWKYVCRMIETLPAATSARPFLSNYVGAAAEVEGIMTQGLRL